jgi:MFS family permease
MDQAPLRQRWLNVVLAAAFINTSYGTLSYSFSVLVTRQAAGGSLGTGTVALAFSLALLVSGVAAVGAGVVADTVGSRRMMAGGAALGAASLALFAACRQPWQCLLVLPLLMGPAMAATFYEPVYVLMNRWFAAPERPRAYGVLTLLSGVSITIFTPLTQALVAALGWREAVLVLAGLLLVAGTAVPVFLAEPAVAPRAGWRPSDLVRNLTDGIRHTTPAFWVFSSAFFFATAAFSGYSFHMVAQLETRGFEDADVARAIAVTGLVSLPARFGLPFLSGRAGSAQLLAACLALLAGAALIASAAETWWQVWVYIGVFGVVFGAVYPLRALVASERFAGPYFGRVIGLQALTVALGRAAGPATIAAIGTDRAAYETGFRLAAAVLVVAAIVTWLSMRGRPLPAAVEVQVR